MINGDDKYDDRTCSYKQLAALGLKIVTYCGQTVTVEVVQQAINTVHIKLEMPLLSYHVEMIW